MAHDTRQDDATGGGIREKLNKYPAVTAGAVLLIAAVALVLAFRPARGPKAYFTVDDGATTFVDDITNLPPFEKDGKQAVRAYMYSCDGGKTLFPGYLERFTPQGKTKAEAQLRGGQAGPTSGVEVKRPGEKDWVAPFDPTSLTPERVARGALRDTKKYEQIMQVKCPQGAGGTALIINPP